MKLLYEEYKKFTTPAPVAVHELAKFLTERSASCVGPKCHSLSGIRQPARLGLGSGRKFFDNRRAVTTFYIDFHGLFTYYINMQLSQERRDEIEKAVLDYIAKNLETRSLKSSELPTIADFMIQKIDTAQNEDDILAFLSELTQKWPIFMPLYTLEKGKKDQSDHQQIIQDVSNLSKEGKIEEAVNLAKSATSDQAQQQ